MSAWSDYKVTHDDADLRTFRQECESDERRYRNSFYDVPDDVEEGEEE